MGYKVTPSILTRIRRVLPLALIFISAAIAFGTYFQTLNYPFISDDSAYLMDKSNLAELQLTQLWRLFIEPYNAFSEFLPLRELSYWFDLTLFGLTPAAFRAHSIVLYLLSLPLAYGVTLKTWRYFCPDDCNAIWAAASVTALFALHPTLVEPVIWISGRKYILPNFFSLLALWFALNVKRDRGFSTPYATAALGAFAAVMLSKATYVPVAGIIAVLWGLFWLDMPVLYRRFSLLLWPAAIILVAIVLAMIFIAKGGGLAGMRKIPFYFGMETLTRTLAVLGWLARLAISPENRHWIYPVFGEGFAIMVAAGIAIVVAAGWGILAILRRRSLEGFAVVAFVLLCLPYLHLIPYVSPSLISDRFLALAAWPATLLLVALAWRWESPLRIILLFVVALSWSFQTVERSRDWRDFETLIDVDVRANPGHFMPVLYKITGFQLARRQYRDAYELAKQLSVPEHRNLVVMMIEAVYAVQVKANSTGNLQEAMERLWNWELKLKNPPEEAQWDLPVNLFWIRNRDVLKDEWGDLAAQFPDNGSVHYNFSLWLLGRNRYQEAIPHLRAATESKNLPESTRGTAYKNLGMALLYIGRAAEAEIPLRTALEQSPPDMRAYCLLAVVYKQTGQFGELARAEANCAQFSSGGN